MNKQLFLSVALACVLPFAARAQESPLNKTQNRVEVYTPTSQPLYLLKTDTAQVRLPKGAIESLDPAWITSVQVLKDKAAVTQYGEKGKHGVVVIELKPDKEQEVLAFIKSLGSGSSNGTTIRLRSETVSDSLPKPLYLVKTANGNIAVSYESLSKISPDWIKAIDVLKGEEAEKRFEEKGKNGVVLITLNSDIEKEALKQLKAVN